MKIWQSYLFARLVKTFLFLFGCIFVAYIIVDLSVHGIRFFSISSFGEILLFYLWMLSILLELLLPLAFLLATMRVLFDLNTHQEITALQMAGLSKKQLLSPFFLFAGLLSIACYLNSQWISPGALDQVDVFKDSHRPLKKRGGLSHVYSISLEDDSDLVYQSFDREKKELFDVFWIKSPSDIWHMKFLEINLLRGHYVNHLTRNHSKQLEKSETFLSKDFPELPWNEEAVLHRFVPIEHRPLSTLFTQAAVDSAERRSIFSHLYYKLLAPLIPFLILLSIGPLSLRFSRDHPFFLVAVCSLFGLISLKVILDGMLILGENQVLPSYIAIFTPIIITLAFALPPFLRMR